MKKVIKTVLAMSICSTILGVGFLGVQKAEAGSVKQIISGVTLYGSISYNTSTKKAISTTYSPETNYLLRANVTYLDDGLSVNGAPVDAYGTATKKKTFSKKPVSLRGVHRVYVSGSWSKILYSTP